MQFYVNAVNLEDIDYTWTDPQGRVLSGSAVYNLKVTQSGTYKCTVWDRYDNTAYAYFVINNGLTSIAKTQIKLSGYSFKYTGKHIEPSAAVTLNGKTYVKGSDYTVEYVDNVNAGTDAAVVIKGNEKTLTGTRKVHFTINKADQTPKMSVKNVTAGKTSTFAVTGSYGTITAKSDNKAIATVSVSGKNVAVKGIKAGETKIKIKTNGYQIQYGLKKNFKGAKSVNVPKYNTVSKVIGGLAKGKTYYVRVRAYKKASGKTYYSAWSNAKTLKIKK